MSLGLFAKYLKDKHPDIKVNVGRKEYDVNNLLVNDHGGEDYYISFKVDDLTKDKGLYIWVIDGVPMYVGIASSDSGLKGRINNEYGNITPYKCTRGGQSQTCRSNVSIRNKYQEGKVISLYVSPVDVDSLKNNKEFMDYMKTLGFKNTRQDKNILEVIEKYIISSSNFKNNGWNRRM
jgi:hypothetical protein